MSFGLPDGESRAFDFRKRLRAVVLADEGVHHPVTARSRRQVFSRYQDITHVAVGPGCLWLGTKRSAYVLPRSAFADPLGPERLLRALLERIGSQPGGGAQRARINDLDARAAELTPPRATLGLAALCVAMYVIEVATSLPIFDAGYMSFALVRDGDLHRFVIANLIHAFWLHLFFNLACLLAVGRMLERAIGSERMLCVMGASALASMLASAWWRDAAVVGVSGVVFGLAAGLLWVELRCAPALPASWRFPRRTLMWLAVALVADSLLGFVVPIIAGEAHLGGFLGGLAATALVTPRSLAPAPAAVLRASRGVLGITALGLLAGAATLAAPGDFTTRHALRVAGLPGIAPEELNNRAWLLATRSAPTSEQLSVARRLAERAVEETQRSDPTILDTLAEVEFLLGHRDAALALIEEAIARKPEEIYYREQRRRFLGERARDDRPDPPLPDVPWGRPPEPDEPVIRDDGITV